jgi:hypothetical protein
MNGSEGHTWFVYKVVGYEIQKDIDICTKGDDTVGAN